MPRCVPSTAFLASLTIFMGEMLASVLMAREITPTSTGRDNSLVPWPELGAKPPARSTRPTSTEHYTLSVLCVDNAGLIMYILSMTHTNAIVARHRSISVHGDLNSKFATEASQLGLEPGVWPRLITVMPASLNLQPNQSDLEIPTSHFKIEAVCKREGEVTHVTYTTHDMPSMRLTVFND